MNVIFIPSNNNTTSSSSSIHPCAWRDLNVTYIYSGSLMWEESKGNNTLFLSVSVPLILASYPLQPDRTGLGCLHFISNIESVTLNEFKIPLHSLGKLFGFMALKKVTWLFRTLSKWMTQLFKCVKYFSRSRFLLLWLTSAPSHKVYGFLVSANQNSFTHSLTACTMTTQYKHVGGKWRSPPGLFFHQNAVCYHVNILKSHGHAWPILK